MDVFTLARACARRWYVVLLGLLITGALAGVQYEHSTATYSNGATYFLVPPARTGNVNNASFNPLGTQATALSIFIQALSSNATQSQVTASTPGATVSAGIVGKTSVLRLDATAADPQQTETALNAYDRVATQSLVQLQQSVQTPASSFYSLRTINSDTGLVVSYAHRSRNTVLVAIGGILITIIIADAVDAAVLSSQRRRQAAGRRRANGPAAPEPHSGDIDPDTETVEGLFAMPADPVGVPRTRR